MQLPSYLCNIVTIKTIPMFIICDFDESTNCDSSKLNIVIILLFISTCMYVRLSSRIFFFIGIVLEVHNCAHCVYIY